MGSVTYVSIVIGMCAKMLYDFVKEKVKKCSKL